MTLKEYQEYKMGDNYKKGKALALTVKIADKIKFGRNKLALKLQKDQDPKL